MRLRMSEFLLVATGQHGLVSDEWPIDCADEDIDGSFYNDVGQPLDGDWYNGDLKVRLCYPVVSRLDPRFVVESRAHVTDPDRGGLPI